jgi:1,4-dihydroxy-2-naphthoate octaprenyltransferase
MTLTAIAIGGFTAATRASVDAIPFALAAIGLLLAHAANNMINDYFDLDLGLDTSTYPRTLYAPHPVTSGLVSKRGLATAIVVVNLCDAIIMLTLFMLRGWPVLAFALGGLFISVFYVAPPLRLKTRGLGEPGVFLVWGPLMVGGLYYSATGSIDWATVAISIPYAFLVTTVLMGKHIDKAPWDAEEKIRTLPVLLGPERSETVTRALIAGFYVAVVLLIAIGYLPIWAALVVLAAPTLVKTWATLSRPKPESPPDGYPLWPLWFASWCFVHARLAGALLVVGLALGAAWPVFLS